MTEQIPDDDLGRILRESYEVSPPDPTFVDSLRRRGAETLASRVPALSDHSASRRRASRARRLWSGIAAAVGIALGVAGVLWLGKPAVSWAQVADAVRERPWIHFELVSPEGEKYESWLHLKDGISVDVYDEDISFEDRRRDVRLRYDKKSKTIYRLSDIDGETQAGFDFFAGLLTQLFRGDPKLDLDVEGIEVTAQSRKEIKKQGRLWIDYQLSLRYVEPDQNATMTFRVDPQTRLPHLMRVEIPDPHIEGQKVEFRLRYPEEGPRDLYAAGVPRDAPIVDQPKPPLVVAEAERPLPADVIKIIDGVQSSARNFDDYFSINVMTPGDAPWHVGTPQLVWHRGRRMRMEMGIVDPRSAPLEPPAADANPARWWMKRLEELWFFTAEVSDGRTFYGNHARPAEWNQNPEHPITFSQEKWPAPQWKSGGGAHIHPISPSLHLAYPIRLNETDWRFELDSDPQDGPPETVRLTVTNPDRSWEERFWIDPQRSFLTVRSEIITRSHAGTDREQVSKPLVAVIVESAQSPKGYWYPLLVRTHGEEAVEGAKPKITYPFTHRYFFDFDAEMPDSLFTPTARPLETE